MTVPIICPSGSFCPSNSSYAHACPPAFLCPYTNMTAPLPCASGDFCPSSGLSAGVSCSQGFYCPPSSAQECRCPVLTFQDETGASFCKNCSEQAVPDTAQDACVTAIAQSPRETKMYFAIVVIFSFVSLSSACLFVVVLRSRSAFSSRPFHWGVCIYIACFVVYGSLKALAVSRLLSVHSEQNRMTAEILLNSTFMIFFWLGFVGKMALIQLWMHLISRHTNEASKGDGSGGVGQHIASARRTWNTLRAAVVVVCLLYSIGFIALLARYFNASAQCSSQIAAASSSDVCILASDSSKPPGCDVLVSMVADIKYFEGIFAGVVAVAFTLYALTFNGLVYAVLTGDQSSSSKLQRAIVGNRILRFILSPYVHAPQPCPHCTALTPLSFIPPTWKPSAFTTAGDMEHWRVSLRRLGTKLSIISVISFASKGVIAALDFYGVLTDGDALNLALSTLIVEAAPTLLTVSLLAVYHHGSAIAVRGSSLGTSLISKDCSSADSNKS